MAKVTVWYDGGCPLCLREIALMQRLDTRNAIIFVDISDRQSECPLDRDRLLARFHASEGGQIVSGAAAFAVMWRAIPVLRPLGLLARNRFILSGLEWLYRRFLVVRPRLQSVMKQRKSI